MAIGHVAVRTHSRRRGHTAAAALAYRAGLALRAPSGRTYDYTERSRDDVLGALIVGVDADSPLADWQTLADTIETAERRSNSQIGRDVQFALAAELPEASALTVAGDIARAIAEELNTVGAIAVHAPDPHGDQRNVHAHFWFATRELNETGDGLAAKIDHLSNPMTSGRVIRMIRKIVEDLSNQALERAGCTARVDTGRRKDGRAPQPKLGPACTELERERVANETEAAGAEPRPMTVAETVTSGKPITGKGTALAEHTETHGRTATDTKRRAWSARTTKRRRRKRDPAKAAAARDPRKRRLPVRPPREWIRRPWPEPQPVVAGGLEMPVFAPRSPWIETPPELAPLLRRIAAPGDTEQRYALGCAPGPVIPALENTVTPQHITLRANDFEARAHPQREATRATAREAMEEQEQAERDRERQKRIEHARLATPIPPAPAQPNPFRRGYDISANDRIATRAVRKHSATATDSPEFFEIYTLKAIATATAEDPTQEHEIDEHTVDVATHEHSAPDGELTWVERQLQIDEHTPDVDDDVGHEIDAALGGAFEPDVRTQSHEIDEHTPDVDDDVGHEIDAALGGAFEPDVRTQSHEIDEHTPDVDDDVGHEIDAALGGAFEPDVRTQQHKIDEHTSDVDDVGHEIDAALGGAFEPDVRTQPHENDEHTPDVDDDVGHEIDAALKNDESSEDPVGEITRAHLAHALAPLADRVFAVRRRSAHDPPWPGQTARALDRACTTPASAEAAAAALDGALDRLVTDAIGHVVDGHAHDLDAALPQLWKGRRMHVVKDAADAAARADLDALGVQLAPEELADARTLCRALDEHGADAGGNAIARRAGARDVPSAFEWSKLRPHAQKAADDAVAELACTAVHVGPPGRYARVQPRIMSATIDRWRTWWDRNGRSALGRLFHTVWPLHRRESEEYRRYGEPAPGSALAPSRQARASTPARSRGDGRGR